jgi:hypothetical protein
MRMSFYDKAREINPNFSPAAFEMGYKFASSPKVKAQMASLRNVLSGVDDLLKVSDEASRTGVPLINQIVLPAGRALGGKRYSNFHTAQIAFADELSGALGYGSATDMSREMGFDMTDPNCRRSSSGVRYRRSHAVREPQEARRWSARWDRTRPHGSRERSRRATERDSLRRQRERDQVDG